MFASLSKLKILIFGWCILPKKLFLNLLPRLDRFEVRASNGLKEIEFLNVNLVTFISLCPMKTILFDLRGAPNLKQLSYVVPSSRLQHFFTHLSEYIHQSSRLYVFAIITIGYVEVIFWEEGFFSFKVFNDKFLSNL